eukprot:2521820-Alexandrium_andersonii.AAC.1
MPNFKSVAPASCMRGSGVPRCLPVGTVLLDATKRINNPRQVTSSCSGFALHSRADGERLHRKARRA